MPAKKKTSKKPTNVRSNAKSRKSFSQQSRPLKLLIIVLVLLLTSVIGSIVYDRYMSSQLKAKAGNWTTVTPPGKNSGIRFVACKQPTENNKFEVTVVAAKEKSLKLTKRNEKNQPLSNHPSFPSIFVGTYQKTPTAAKAYEYSWEGQVTRPGANANRWWNNEVTATNLRSLKQPVANGDDKLLVYGMSDQANAPDIRLSGSGQVVVTGSIFTDTPPRPDNFPGKPLEYNKARVAWEKKVPTVRSLQNCQ